MSLSKANRVFSSRLLQTSDGDTGIWLTDLKPENVMLVPDPVNPDDKRIKVLDFGIANITQTNLVEKLVF